MPVVSECICVHRAGWLDKLDGYLEIKDCADVFTSWPQAKIFIRVVYTFMFFVMVSAIGLEIVFGIVDTCLW